MAQKLEDRTMLTFEQVNPKRKGSKVHERYERYKAAKTFSEALHLGATRADVTSDIKAGFCAVAGNEEPPAKRPRVEARQKEDSSNSNSLSPKPTPAKVDAPAATPAVAAAAASVATAASSAAAPTTIPTGTSAASSSSSSKPAATLGRDVDLSFVDFQGKDLRYMRRVTGEAKKLLCEAGIEDGKREGYSFKLLDRKNLSKWAVRITDLNPDGKLAKGLAKMKLENSIDLEMTLPDNYPLGHPFVRVTYPQLRGGYVFERGGICFEPLTAKGWSPSMQLPNLAIAIKGILDYGDVAVAGEGNRAARIVPHYTEEGARKDAKVISDAHQGGDSRTYGSLRHYRS